MNSARADNVSIEPEDARFFSKLWDKNPSCLSEFLPDTIEIIDEIVDYLTQEQISVMREDLLILLRLTEFSLDQELKHHANDEINRYDYDIIIGTIEILLFSLDFGEFANVEDQEEE